MFLSILHHSRKLRPWKKTALSHHKNIKLNFWFPKQLKLITNGHPTWMMQILEKWYWRHTANGPLIPISFRLCSHTRARKTTFCPMDSVYMVHWCALKKKIGHIAFLHNAFQCTAVQDKNIILLKKVNKNLLKRKTTEKKGVIKTQCITWCDQAPSTQMVSALVDLLQFNRF